MPKKRINTVWTFSKYSTKKKIVGLYQAHKSKIKFIGFIVLGAALSFSGLFETLTLLSAFILVATYALLLK